MSGFGSGGRDAHRTAGEDAGATLQLRLLRTDN